MLDDKWLKIEKIFNDAVLLPTGEQPAFIAESCGDDIEMCEELNRMIAEDANRNNLLELPIFTLGLQLLGTDLDETAPPTDFADYKIRQLLGRGGMGAVYLAEDLRLKRLIALKILSTAATRSSEAVTRFQQEARSVSAISHPNVAHIYEFGEFGGQHFLAMEYVPGQTLRELLSAGKLDVVYTLEIALQITKALISTHQAGIIHRDIKPENVMICKDCHVKVLDFGLAKYIEPTNIEENNRLRISTSDKTSLDTVPGMIIGTTAYMSPEQIRGKGLDARTDLWSFGVVLFEMLTAKHPFTGDTVSDVQAAVLLGDLTIGDCPKSLRQIVGTLLLKNPSDRYQSAEDLLKDLHCLKEASDAEKRSPGIAAKIKKHKIITGGLLILLFGLSAASFRIFSNYATLPSRITPVNSIAVLPFVSENSGEDDNYLSDGLTDALTNKLSRLPNLSVKARSSVFQYKGQTIDPQTVGQELSVQVVLLGRVVEQNDALTVNLNLVDGRTGSQIWSKQYNRRNADLILLQNEMARDVSANFRSHLSGADEQILGKNYTENVEAYRFYMKGRFYWNKRTAKDLKKSIEYFEQAAALDPNFALAFAGIADTYLLMSGNAALSPRESFPKAKTAALKALGIDDALAEAHNALAYELFNYEWNAADAEREIKLAIELNPNYATAHQWYGNSILLGSGRFEEAIAESKRAQELDPLSLIINADLGTTLLFARRTDEAVEQFQKTIEMDDNFAYAHVFLGRAYLMRNDFPAAIAQCQKAQSLGDDPRPLVILARIYAKLGRKKESVELLDRLKNIGEQKYVSAYYFALVCAGLGENDEAFKYLEKAFQDREGRMTLLNVDSLMDELRADRRFKDLVRRIGLFDKFN